MSAGLWILIAVLVVIVVVAGFVAVRMRQRSGTILAARGPAGTKDPGGGR